MEHILSSPSAVEYRQEETADKSDQHQSDKSSKENGTHGDRRQGSHDLVEVETQEWSPADAVCPGANTRQGLYGKAQRAEAGGDGVTISNVFTDRATRI